jgi:Lar family restriction alleviation protein
VKKTDLKPCPFCGGKKLRIHEGFSHECAQVVCDTCDVSLTSSEEYEASGTIWNTRVVPEPLFSAADSELIDQLRARIAVLETQIANAPAQGAQNMEALNAWIASRFAAD